MADLHESRPQSTKELPNSIVLNQEEFISWLFEWIKEGRGAGVVSIGGVTRSVRSIQRGRTPNTLEYSDKTNATFFNGVIELQYTVGAVLYEANGKKTISLILDQKASN